MGVDQGIQRLVQDIGHVDGGEGTLPAPEHAPEVLAVQVLHHDVPGIAIHS